MHSLLFSRSMNPFFSSHNTLDESIGLFESEQAFLFEILVPGFNKKDFQISASEHTLTIKAEKQVEEVEGYQTLQKGSRPRSLEQSFRFRQSISAENVEAEVKDGLLRLKVPKKSTQTMVEIKAS